MKFYLYPENPVDNRLHCRFKRGLINYAAVQSWWTVPPLQHWIKRSRFRFRWADHHPIHLEVSGADVTHLWVADELLLERVYRLGLVPFEPTLVLDLGANIGLFSILAARQWPRARLVCVEPHPETFSYLVQNLSLNRVTAAKLQCAVDAQAGFSFLGNEGAVFQQLSATPTSVQVVTLELDALLPRDPDTRLLIKMDIEGSEVRVLDALRTPLPAQCFIFLELHNGDASIQWIERWAQAHGFAFGRLRRRGDAIDGFLTRETELEPEPEN